MAIDRAPWNALVDDDGSNLVGTVWNKDKIKTVLLDPADAAYLPTFGSWTPVDASGAGLAFSYAAGTWARIDRLIMVWFQVVYPATSNSALASIGGLPVIVAVPGSGGVHGYGPFRVWLLSPGGTVIKPMDPTTAGQQTNANMSGVNTIVNAIYLTT